MFTPTISKPDFIIFRENQIQYHRESSTWYGKQIKIVALGGAAAALPCAFSSPALASTVIASISGVACLAIFTFMLAKAYHEFCIQDEGYALRQEYQNYAQLKHIANMIGYSIPGFLVTTVLSIAAHAILKNG